MAKYDITAPDGQTYEVEAPDNAPEAAVLAYAKANYNKLPPPLKHSVPTMKESMAEELATRSMPEKLLVGVGTFVDDAAMRAKQLFGNKLTPQETANVQANRDMTSESGAALAGNIGGSLAATGVPATALIKGVAAGAGKILPRFLAPTAGAATGGATTAALTQPVLEGESTGQNMAVGALGGVLGDSGARVLGRVAQPLMQSPAVQRLLARGVVPTPGETAGADSFLGRAEQKIQSLFGVGDIVKRGRERSATEANKAALNTAMPEGKVTAVGQEGMDQVSTALSNAYDKVFAGKVVMPNQQLLAAVNAAKQAPTLPLGSESEKTFDAIIKKVFAERIPRSGQIAAETVKGEIVGDLGKQAARFQQSNDAYQKALGDALMAARNEVNNWLKAEISKNDPRAAAQLANIDKVFANKGALQKAVERAKGKDGLFTGNQLQNATKPGQPLRELANDMNSVLGQRVPNSGTTDRAALLATLGIGGAGVANEYFGGPGYLTALAAAPLAYSRTGSRYLAGNLAGQGKLAEILRNSAPYAAQVGAAGAKK